MLDPLYKIKVNCLNCKSDFETSRVRPNFKIAVFTDTDFYVRYKQANPDYYVVRVCPYCGFATSENFSPHLSEASQKAYFEKYGKHWQMRDFGGERSWEEALQSYQLGLLCAQIKGEKDRLIAGLLHRIAWLYREKGNEQQEKRFLQYALDAYVKVYEWEEGSLDNARLMYLLGELNRRLGNYNEALKWFGRVINDKKIMDAGMIRACREQWAVTRETMAAERMEVPPDLEA